MSAKDFIKYSIVRDKGNVIWNLKRILRAADPKVSKYWKESDEHYSNLDVRGKKVLVIGADFGVTPMYFLSKGAQSVVGYSLWKQYFFHPNYEHRQEPFYVDKLDGEDFDVMSSDCEGCEYGFTKELLNRIGSHVICFHEPVLNNDILEYARRIATRLIRPPPFDPLPPPQGHPGQWKPEVLITEVIR